MYSTGNAPNSTSTYLVHYIFADDVYTNLEQISAKEATWMRILIFGSDFWDPHRKRNSNSIFDSRDSGRIFFEIPMSEKLENWNSDLRNFEFW